MAALEESGVSISILHWDALEFEAITKEYFMRT